MNIYRYIKQHFIAVVIAISGFMSAIVTLFINVNQSISIKWVLLLIFLSLVIIILLIGYMFQLLNFNCKDYNFNLHNLKLKDLNKKTDRGEVFLNKSNIDFTYGDVVKVYYLDKNKIERFIGIGIISHVQKEQKICHIEFLYKNNENIPTNDVYFSLKINKDELNSLIQQKD